MSVLSENRPPVFGYYVNDAFVAVKEGEIYCKPLPHIYDLDIEIDGNNFSNLKDRDKIYYDLNPNSNIELNIKYCDYEKIKSESLVFKAELKDISKTKVTGGETSQLVVNEKGAKEFSLDLNLTQNNVSGIFNVDMSLSCKDINDSIFDFTRRIIIDKTANLESKKVLAKLYNQDSGSFDKEYSKQYLAVYKNFSDIEYKAIDADDLTIMKVGARKDNIKGFDIEGDRFAVHLIHCDRRSQSCAFRINGVPTGKLYTKNTLSKQTEFSLTKDYSLKIDSIKFDFCDGRRFCNLFHEAYDVVDVEVKGK